MSTSPLYESSSDSTKTKKETSKEKFFSIVFYSLVSVLVLLFFSWYAFVITYSLKLI